MTPERLREVLKYNPWTGEFHWIVTLSPRAVAGSVAGRITEQGFVKIRIDGRDYLAHRLACLYMKRRWPVRLINHKNRRRADNRWPNLREATSSDICGHARPRRDDMSRGVDSTPNGFRARIHIGDKTVHLGYHRSESVAYRAYLGAARAYWGEFAVE